jgi:ubiquinone/menaquinone biosynthesis C-methylase UbiE
MTTSRSESFEKWKDHWKRTARSKNSLKDAFYLMDRIKMEYLLPLFPKRGKRTLEVGAGSGRLSRFLADVGHDVYCLDYCHEALKYATRCFQEDRSQGKFVEGKAEELPFDDETFDLVFSTGLLEHFENPVPLVKEMVRVLRSGGLFYSDIVPKKFSLLRSLEFVRPLLKREWNPMFEMPFTDKDITAFLKEACLEKVTVFPAAVFPPCAPILRRFETVRWIESLLAQAATPLLKHLDGTWLADCLGFYYFAYGYK